MTELVDRAKMTTATTGTGTSIVLGSAVAGFQTLADAGVTDGDTVEYIVEDGTSWEHCEGVYTASTTELSRTTIASSNAGAAISLSGSAVVFVTASARMLRSLGGAWSVIDSQDAPSLGVFDFTGLDLSEYAEVMVVMEALTVGTAGRPLLTFYVGGPEIVTGYYYAQQSHASTGSADAESAENSSNIPLLNGTSTNWQIVTSIGSAFSGIVRLLAPTSGSYKNVRFEGVSSQGASGATVTTEGGGALRNTGAIDGVKVAGSNSLAGGRVTLIGLRRSGSVGSGSTVYDLGMVQMANPGDGDVMGTVVLPRAMTLSADFAGSAGDVDTNPAASFVISVTKNGTEVGTITISTAGAFTFATTGGTAVSITAGDIIRFVAGNDASIAGIAVTLAGELT